MGTAERQDRDLTAHTWNHWDDEEGVNAACKPLRDGLVDARVIHSDAADSGHVFSYAQIVDRARRGVEITVELGEGL